MDATGSDEAAVREIRKTAWNQKDFLGGTHATPAPSRAGFTDGRAKPDWLAAIAEIEAGISTGARR